MSEHQYWSMVSAEAELQSAPKAAVTDGLVAAVRDGVAAGEPWALQVMDRWCQRGAGDDYTRAHKALHALVYVRRDGTRVRKTTSYSRPVVDGAGDIVGQQLTVWWGMERPQLTELRDDLRSQLGALADAVRLVTEVLRVMDRHPEALTAGEAWSAEGRSLNEVDLAAVAS